MEDLLEIAQRPVVATGPEATVRQLAELLKAERIGAVVVLDGGNLVGIVSERDIVRRVVAERRDPETTRVSEIMITDVRTAHPGMKIPQALEMMDAGRFRHLPLVDAAGAVVGMLSIRHLLRRRMVDLDMKNADLISFISTDGPGG
jgi:CBS domain-containing protein